MRSTTILPMICLVQTAMFAGHCDAQVADEDYGVYHDFHFRPSGDVVDVVGLEFRHAWVQTDGIFGDAWSVEALMQDPDFDPFGTESLASGPSGVPIAFNTGIAGTPVQCNYNIFTIPPGGINSYQCIILPLGSSFADACTEFSVPAYSTTPPFDIHGTIGSSGGVHAIRADCYAYSSAGISVRGGVDMGNGMIQWSPAISDTVGGGTSAMAGLHDPIHLVATNLVTGDQIQASFFDYTLTTDGPGMVRWENGVFETDHTDLEFRLEVPSAYVAPSDAGSLLLRLEHGVVTASDDDGAFDGLLPPVGTTSPFNFPFPTDFDINYDLNLDPTFPWEVTADLSGAGGVQATGGCLADLNGDGLLNFFDISIFLELFTDGDLAVDFNGDKMLDFFDVSMFLGSFAEGCIG